MGIRNKSCSAYIDSLNQAIQNCELMQELSHTSAAGGTEIAFYDDYIHYLHCPLSRTFAVSSKQSFPLLRVPYDVLPTISNKCCFEQMFISSHKDCL